LVPELVALVLEPKVELVELVFALVQPVFASVR
jgi:hypothetical protein